MANNRILVAYVPVLHEGYRKLLADTQPSVVYVLGKDLIADHDELRKDIRALAPERVAEALQSWPNTPQMVIADAETLAGIPDEAELVLPDETVSRDVAKKHFADRDVTFHPIFLRWDREKALAEQDVHPGATVSESELDQKFLGNADDAAKRSSDWWRRVGAVAVKGDEVILEAANEHVPSPHTPWADGDPRNSFKRGIAVEFGTSIHAEARIIVEAAREGISLAGAKLYVTTFPCQHCAKLIAYAGISELYYRSGYAVLDGLKILEANGIKIIQVTGGDPETHGPEWVPYPGKKN